MESGKKHLQDQFIGYVRYLLEGLASSFPDCLHMKEVQRLFEEFVVGKPNHEESFLMKWQAMMGPLYISGELEIYDENYFKTLLCRWAAQGHERGVHLLNYGDPAVIIAKLELAEKMDDPYFTRNSKQNIHKLLRKLTIISNEWTHHPQKAPIPLEINNKPAAGVGSQEICEKFFEENGMGALRETIGDSSEVLAKPFKQICNMMKEKEINPTDLDMSTIIDMSISVMQSLDQTDIEEIAMEGPNLLKQLKNMIQQPEVKAHLGVHANNLQTLVAMSDNFLQQSGAKT